MIKISVSVLLMLFPWFIRRNILNLLFGYKIHKSAKIGFSLVAPDHLEMNKNSRIGHFNICKGLNHLKLGESAIIENFNWISCLPLKNKISFKYKKNRDPSLILGEHSAITSRHILDCIDTVIIGRYTTVAGNNSLFLTHSINLVNNRQECNPIEIGDYCFLGARCVVLPGSVLPSYCVVSSFSLLNRKLTVENVMYGGVPVRTLKTIPSNWQYFNRTEGIVL